MVVFTVVVQRSGCGVPTNQEATLFGKVIESQVHMFSPTSEELV